MPGRLHPTIVPAIVGIIGLCFPILLFVHAYQANGFHGLPLDDAWIHLTYARNLITEGSFTYFPGTASTAGSTSPLYTLLLAASLPIFSNEVWLSSGLSLLFHAGFLVVFALWAQRRLQNILWTCAAVLFVALDGRIGALALSGMETSLFLFLVSLTFYAHERNKLLTALALGLAVWARPEGLILIGVFAVDLLLTNLWLSPRENAETQSSKKPLALLGWLVGGYLLFHWLIGSSLLPNTFAAKTTYYGLNSRLFFLNQGLFNFLTSGGWLVLFAFVPAMMVRAGWRLVRKESAELSVETGWVVALLLAYVIFLPFTNLFDRYLIPALPALAILVISGVLQTSKWLLRKELNHWIVKASGLVLFVTVISLQVQGALATGFTYINYCRTNHDTQQLTGLWFADNSPAEAVIATHDVGAIAYYSRRKVVDVVGLVQPDVVSHLHTPGYVKYLEQLFQRERVTLLAMKQDWLEVDNVQAVFATGEPDVMEVYLWHPGRTHLVHPAVSGSRGQAVHLLQTGQTQAALSLLRQLVQVDPLSSKTWELLGIALEHAGRAAEARDAYLKVIELAPHKTQTRERLKAIRNLVQ